MLSLKNPALLKSHCLLGEGWVDAQDGSQIAVTNPFNNEQIGTVPSLTQAQVEQAVTDAEAAQVAWAALTAAERGKLLHKWADLIDENNEDLAVLMTAEQGKPLKESRGEITYANSFIRWFAEEGKRVYGDVIPSTKTTQRITVLKQPVGVCAAITPWIVPAGLAVPLLP